MSDGTATVLGLIVAAFALLLALMILIWVFRGAILLFFYAGESGFIGHVIYFALWIVVFPIMLVVCLLVGLFAPN